MQRIRLEDTLARGLISSPDRVVFGPIRYSNMVIGILAVHASTYH